MSNMQTCVFWISAVIGAAGTAHAQTATNSSGQSASPTSASSGGLDEIVVSATRRKENQQDVPIAVTAFTAESLQVKGITTTEDLQIATPGLSMTQETGASSPYIRGVGTANASTPGLEAPVATYVDGVYYPQNTGNVFAFNNVANVEVDRGPQGTLFGRNSTGGAIVVTTLDPQSTPAARGSIDYQNYKTVEGSFYVTGGLTSNVASDLAVYGIHQDEGFGRNLTTGASVDYQRLISARSKTIWTLTDDDRITFAFDGMENTSDIGVVVAAVPGSILLNGLSHIGGPNDTTQNTGPSSNTQTWTASVKYAHDYTWGSFSSLTAFHSEATHYLWNVNATNANILPADISDFSRSFQQEILFSGRGLGNKLLWTSGVFIYYADQGLNQFDSGSFIPPVNINSKGTETTDSYSAFGEATYSLTDKTSVTMGLRYTADERRYSAATTQLAGNVAPGSVVYDLGDKSFGDPSWRFAIDHKFTDDVMTYFRYDRGYKSGLFNLSDPGQPPVQPEKLDAYEVGVKSELLDRTVRANLAVFYYNYSNIQLGSAAGDGLNELLNAASAHIKGGELEIVYAPQISLGRLHFDAGVSYLDAKYENFPGGPIITPTGVGGNIETYGNLAGFTMIHAPKDTVSLGASYSIPIANNELGINANYYHNSGFFWQPDDSLRQPAYGVLNGQLSFGFGTDQKYRVRVFGKNLTNTHYAVWEIATTLGDIENEANPRTYGIGFDFKL
jgi:iron complex outermembrane recepter protein